MNALRTACLVAAVTAAAMLVGCNSFGRSQDVNRTNGTVQAAKPAPVLAAKRRPEIPDVPVPEGFKLDESRSRNYDTGVARFVDHLYRGSKHKWDVTRFYRDQMPVSRWTYVNYVFAQGMYTLEFEKGSERCVVSVRDGSALWPWRRTRIEVRVTTMGRISQPRTRK